MEGKQHWHRDKPRGLFRNGNAGSLLPAFKDLGCGGRNYRRAAPGVGADAAFGRPRRPNLPAVAAAGS